MGQLWLCLLALAALFGLAAPRARPRHAVPMPPPYGSPHVVVEATSGSDAGGHQPPDLANKAFAFPRATDDSHALGRAKPEQPLQNFTLCLRSCTRLTRPHGLFSYATKAQGNDILLFKPKPSEYRLYVGGKFVAFRVPEGVMASEHVCASWESTPGIVGFWLNGKPWPRQGLQRGYAVGAEAAILLGQEQDAFGGGFDAHKSFVGEMCSVYTWDTGISTSAVDNRPPNAPIFGWRNFPYATVGEVLPVAPCAPAISLGVAGKRWASRGCHRACVLPTFPAV